MEIICRNVNDAYARALDWLRIAGVKENSRNGTVIVSPEPVIITYHRPMERVLFSPLRDANPWLHLMEALWMIAGHDDLAWVAQFASRMATYSDDGKTLRSAYGKRWREHFGYDQLKLIVEELKRNPETRRAVLAIWDAAGVDAYGGTCDSELAYGMKGGKDVTCNTHVYFDRRGKGNPLNMTVCNRSNDAIWGAFGANAVHFSILQEFMSAWVGCPVGVYRQFSNNLHMYPENFKQDLYEAARDAEINNTYLLGAVSFPLVSIPIDAWQGELYAFLVDPLGERNLLQFTEPFFRNVATPMYRAWYERKNKISSGLEWASTILAKDWSLACENWITRREEKKLAAS